MTRAILAALALALAACAQAQQREFYDARTGKVVARTATDSSGAVTFYDAAGRVVGRETTDS